MILLVMYMRKTIGLVFSPNLSSLQAEVLKEYVSVKHPGTEGLH